MNNEALYEQVTKLLNIEYLTDISTDERCVAEAIAKVISYDTFIEGTAPIEGETKIADIQNDKERESVISYLVDFVNECVGDFEQHLFIDDEEDDYYEKEYYAEEKYIA